MSFHWITGGGRLSWLICGLVIHGWLFPSWYLLDMSLNCSSLFIVQNIFIGYSSYIVTCICSFLLVFSIYCSTTSIARKVVFMNLKIFLYTLLMTILQCFNLKPHGISCWYRMKYWLEMKLCSKSVDHIYEGKWVILLFHQASPCFFSCFGIW